VKARNGVQIKAECMRLLESVEESTIACTSKQRFKDCVRECYSVLLIITECQRVFQCFIKYHRVL
jgi:hypothetical protein